MEYFTRIIVVAGLLMHAECNSETVLKLAMKFLLELSICMQEIFQTT